MQEPLVSWKKGRLLGNGRSATVSAAVLYTINSTLTVAVKSSPSHSSRVLQREESILNRLRGCPHIVSSFGHHEDDGGYNLFMELAPCGSLYDLITKSPGGLPEITVRRYARRLLLGLAHVHRNDYVHCDVKPHNVLVWNERDVKLADFGLAKPAGERIVGSCLRGTPLYIAPECARNQYDPPVDIWSLGCTVIEMLTGEPAWKLPPDTEWPALVFKMVVLKATPEIPEGLSEECEDFLRRCIVREPEKRWTAEMLLKHPFVSGVDAMEGHGVVPEHHSRSVWVGEKACSSAVCDAAH